MYSRIFFPQVAAALLKPPVRVAAHKKTQKKICVPTQHALPHASQPPSVVASFFFFLSLSLYLSLSHTQCVSSQAIGWEVLPDPYASTGRALTEP
jgi:hypothetical protein